MSDKHGVRAVVFHWPMVQRSGVRRARLVSKSANGHLQRAALNRF